MKKFISVRFAIEEVELEKLRESAELYGSVRNNGDIFRILARVAHGFTQDMKSQIAESLQRQGALYREHNKLHQTSDK